MRAFLPVLHRSTTDNAASLSIERQWAFQCHPGLPEGPFNRRSHFRRKASPAARNHAWPTVAAIDWLRRSEEHTSELQSLMRISYAVFCLKKKINNQVMNNSTKSHIQK